MTELEQVISGDPELREICSRISDPEHNSVSLRRNGKYDPDEGLRKIVTGKDVSAVGCCAIWQPLP